MYYSSAFSEFRPCIEHIALARGFLAFATHHFTPEKRHGFPRLLFTLQTNVLLNKTLHYLTTYCIIIIIIIIIIISFIICTLRQVQLELSSQGR
jgi:hypothetical protein